MAEPKQSEEHDTTIRFPAPGDWGETKTTKVRLPEPLYNAIKARKVLDDISIQRQLLDAIAYHWGIDPYELKDRVEDPPDSSRDMAIEAKYDPNPNPPDVPDDRPGYEALQRKLEEKRLKSVKEREMECPDCGRTVQERKDGEPHAHKKHDPDEVPPEENEWCQESQADGETWDGRTMDTDSEHQCGCGFETTDAEDWESHALFCEEADAG